MITLCWEPIIFGFAPKILKKHVPRRGIEPRPRRWERRILTTRPPGKVGNCGINLGVLYICESCTAQLVNFLHSFMRHHASICFNWQFVYDWLKYIRNWFQELITIWEHICERKVLPLCHDRDSQSSAVTRIRTWVVSATTRSTNHYTITAIQATGDRGP